MLCFNIFYFIKLAVGTFITVNVVSGLNIIYLPFVCVSTAVFFLSENVLFNLKTDKNYDVKYIQPHKCNVGALEGEN